MIYEPPVAIHAGPQPIARENQEFGENRHVYPLFDFLNMFLQINIVYNCMQNISVFLTAIKV